MATDKKQPDIYDEGAQEDWEGEDAAGQDGAGSGDIFSRVRWGRVGLVCLFAFLVLAAVLFVWNRWYRFDDAADIQGTWRDASTGKLLELDSTLLQIDGDVVYEYTLDTFAKTISYSLGDDEGASSYRFNESRQKLVLEDGAGTDWGLVFHFRDDPGFADGDLPEGMTRLEKISDDVPKLSLPGSGREKTAVVAVGPTASSSSSSSSSTSSSSLANAASSANAGSAASTGSAAASPDIPAEEQAAMAEGRIVINGEGVYGYFDSQGQWVDSVQNWGSDAAEADVAQATDGSGAYGAGSEGAYETDTEAGGLYGTDVGTQDLSGAGTDYTGSLGMGADESTGLYYDATTYDASDLSGGAAEELYGGAGAADGGW